MLQSRLLSCALAVVTALSFFDQVWASGFAIYDHGAKEQAQGNAVVATVDTPAAVFYNPSRLEVLDGANAEVGVSAGRSVLRFDSDLSGENIEVSSTPLVPYAFYSYQISNKMTLGAGLYSSMGNRIDYPNDWEGRFLVTSSEFKQVNFALSAGVRISDRTAVGLSVGMARSTIELENRIDLTPFTLPGEGSARLTAEGYGAYGILGVHHDFGPRFGIGAVYTTPMKISYDGHASYSVPAPLTPLFPNGGADTSLTVPQSAVVGAAWRFSPDWVAEVDVQWVDWNELEEQKIEFERTTAVVRDTSIPYRLKSTWTYRVGTLYRISDTSQWRAGYAFDPSASRNSGMSPILPDVDNHTFTVGYGYKKGSWNLDGFLAYNYGAPRKVNNSLPRMPEHRGTYQSQTIGGGVSVTYSF